MIMEKTVKIPEGVTVDVHGTKVSVSGKNAKLERDFASSLFGNDVKIEKHEGTIKVSTGSVKRKMKSEVGCVSSTIENMMGGALKDYQFNMKIVFMHFPVTVKVDGDKVVIANFLGERSPRKARIMEGTKVVVGKETITITGPDKEKAGQTCANIEIATRVASRDRRVYQDGIFLVG